MIIESFYDTETLYLHDRRTLHLFLDRAMTIANLLRKHSGKTGEELKAEGK